MLMRSNTLKGYNDVKLLYAENVGDVRYEHYFKPTLHTYKAILHSLHDSDE